MDKKQVIGIDVSSQKLNLHFLDNGADFEIANTQESINSFLKQKKLSAKNCIFGAESTGRCHLVCQDTLVRQNFEFKLINPILTGKRIASSIRKKKTDRNDAKFIAQLVSQGEGRVIDVKQLDVTKKTLLRTRTSIVNQRTGIKIILKELNMVKNSRDKKITKEEELIQSFPGFGSRLAAIVSTETGGFSRFPTSTQFKAYVGIDPKVTQSGGSLKTGKITKRGNAHLRTAFYLAAQVARCHDPELKEFYQKKKAEGKPTRSAIIAVARKLCERVFAIVKRGTPYEVRKINSQPALT